MSGETLVDLSEKFPVTRWRVARRSLLSVVILAFACGGIVLLDHLGPEAFRVSRRAFTLISAGIVLALILGTFARLVFEWIAVSLHRTQLDSSALIVAKGVFRRTVEKIPLDRAAMLQLSSSPIDALFGLSNLGTTEEKHSGRKIAIEGLKRDTALRLHEELVRAAKQGASPDSRPGEAARDERTVAGGGSERRGEAMSKADEAREKAAKEQLEKARGEKEALEKQAAAAHEELDKVNARKTALEDLAKVEEEKRAVSGDLKATQEQLRAARESQKEEDRMQEMKKQLEAARHKLDVVREEKRLQDELEKTTKELEIERHSIEEGPSLPGNDGPTPKSTSGNGRAGGM